MGNKRRIGVDVDDVLANFVDALMLYHNEVYGTKLTREYVKNFSFHDIWGGTAQERIQKVNHFFETDYSDNMRPVEGSQEAIDSLALSNDLFLVTSRPLAIKEKTEQWLNQFFGDRFSGIFHSSNYYSGAVGRSKLEICRELGVFALIDDSLDYIKPCPSMRIRGILFGDYAWNQNGKLPSGIIRVKNWKEALKELN